jgi:aldehyde dehydrogenase (NAD+)
MTGESEKVKKSASLNFSDLIASQREFYNTDATKDLSFRLRQLKKLYKILVKRESDIIQALIDDFGKAPLETYGTEISLVKKEIKYLARRLPNLMRKRRVGGTLLSFPSSNYIYSEPYGVTFIIGAWNYPLLLTLLPAVGAIAAGNCVILKPSELSTHTSQLIKKMIGEIFETRFFEVVEGGPDETQAILKQPLDYIFFTGSPRVGKIILEAASRQLIPVTLELGGKSPCIVEPDANLRLAAKRIVWGKCVNGGQTCIAPDYLYVHESIKQDLLNRIAETIHTFYGKDPIESPDFPSIINRDHFDRLKGLMKSGDIVVGGNTNSDKNKIAPTILDNVDWNDPVMKEEIFGPILPVLSYQSLDEVINTVKSQPRSLALYLFTTSRKTRDKVLKRINFGGGCINDALFQFGNSKLPLGGIGNSGMGQYHGTESFNTFSHKKSIVAKPNWLDIPVRYAPYKGKFKLVKRLLEI